MKRRKFLLILLAVVGISSLAQNNVIQLYNEDGYKPLDWNNIESLNFSIDNNVTRFHLYDGEIIDVPFEEMTESPLYSGPAIPLLEITTDEELTEILDKINYKTAKIKLSGFGNYEDMELDVNIRGRGNSSWTHFPKKPYRLKFAENVSLCELDSAKNYVLLANYSDVSLMHFALACRMAQMFDMPFAPKVVPVDVILNGQYKGSYILCNKPGINNGSVNIDESTSIMWELDVSYDEDYKFKSPIYNAPVQAVDPDLDDERFEYWKNDYIEMEKAVSELNGAQYIDMAEFAKYILVYDLMANVEIWHPKSVKFYKTEGGKYTFGPIWDFDWSMGADGFSKDNIINGKHTIYNSWPYPVEMHPFLEAIFNHQEALENIKKYWDILQDNVNELYDFIDIYSATIRQSALRDKARWNNRFDFDETCLMMKEWLRNHIDDMKEFEYLK